jgi:Transposase DDE domain
MPPGALYQWTDRVTSRFPSLTRCQARLLAEYSFGLVVARCCGLNAVALALAGLLRQSFGACRQRLREWYREAGAKAGRCRTEVDPACCFGPLLDWVLATWTSRRLAVALDPTYLGDRFIVLAVGVVYRGCAVPVAWKAVAADRKGSWLPHWRALLAGLAGRLGPGWTVTVLSDRGLESKELFGAVTALGWHPLMRAKGAGHFRPDGWRRFGPMARLAPRPGCRWRGRGEAYADPRARLRCTLLALWEPGHAEPWLVLTDLAPADADAAWYGWRCWVEQSFKVAKRAGWQWQHTRMADPARAARLWAVLAVATVWAMEVGGEGAALEVPGLPRAQRLVRAGLLRLLVALLRGEPLPRGRFLPQEWADRSWQPDPLTEPLLNQC